MALARFRKAGKKVQLGVQMSDEAKQARARAQEALRSVADLEVLVRVNNTFAAFNLKTKASATIDMVMEAIASSQRIPMSSIRCLQFKGYSMQRRWTLYRCRVKSGDTIVLFLHKLSGPMPVVSGLIYGHRPRPGRSPHRSLFDFHPAIDPSSVASKDSVGPTSENNIIYCATEHEPRDPIVFTINLELIRKLTGDPHLLPVMMFKVGEDGRSVSEAAEIMFDDEYHVNFNGSKEQRSCWEIDFRRTAVMRHGEPNNVGTRVVVRYKPVGGFVPGNSYTFETWGHSYADSVQYLNLQKGTVKFTAAAIEFKPPDELPEDGSFGESGVLWWYGTYGGQKEYVNPGQSWQCKVARSSDGHARKYHFVDCYPLGEGVHTKARENSWMQVDMGEGRHFWPTAYALRHGYMNDKYILRNWVLEATNDVTLESWTTLSDHDEDAKLSGNFGTAMWTIDPPLTPVEPIAPEDHTAAAEENTSEDMAAARRDEGGESETKGVEDGADGDDHVDAAVSLTSAPPEPGVASGDDAASIGGAVEAPSLPSDEMLRSGDPYDIPAERRQEFRFFRIRQTGPNSTLDNFLAVAGFEMWGALRGYVGPQRDFKDKPKPKPKKKKKKKAAAAAAAEPAAAAAPNSEAAEVTVTADGTPASAPGPSATSDGKEGEDR